MSDDLVSAGQNAVIAVNELKVQFDRLTNLRGTDGYALVGRGSSLFPQFQGFYQPLSNASTRTWGSKAADIRNAADWGVVGNGTTDDTTNINRAITAVSCEDGGGSLYLNPGTYLIDSGDIELLSDVELFGAGAWATSIVLTDANQIDSFGRNNNCIHDLTISGSALSSAGATMLRWQSGNYNRAYNVIFDHTPDGGLGFAIQNSDGHYQSVTNCLFFKDTQNPNGIHEAMIAFSNVPGTYITFNNNILINTQIQGNWWWSQFNNNVIYGAAYGAAIAFNRGTGGSSVDPIGNNVFNNICLFGSTVPDSDGTWISGMELNGDSHKIVGNICANNGGAGIHWTCRNTLISQNICFDNGTYSPSPGLSALSYVSTENEVTAYNCIVSNNRCFDTVGSTSIGQNYGYIETLVTSTGSSAIKCFLDGNDFEGNAVGEVNLSSSTLSRYTIPASVLLSTTVTAGAIAFNSSQAASFFTTYTASGAAYKIALYNV